MTERKDMTEVAEEKNTYLSSYSEFARQAGNGRPWLDRLRQSAIDRFDSVGFPSSTDEAWRHTNINPITRTAFQHAEREELAGDHISDFSFGTDAAAELVFVNGHFAPGLSRIANLPRGVRIKNLAGALEKDSAEIEKHLGKYASIESNPFVALNTGFVRDGAYVHLTRGTIVENPIHLLFISSPGNEPSVSHPRVLFIAEEGAKATIVETYAGIGQGVYFTNAVTEIFASANSHIDHYKMQQEALQAFHVATMQVQLERDGNFVSHSASLGSKLTRNDLNVVMNGPNAYATLNGLVIISGDQHIDNHTLLCHDKPHCLSHELYKHVLSDRAAAVFHGKIYVQKDAQKTDSKQTSKALLLSDNAVMNSQPALEIYADDVKCTHGSTIGPVDEEMVFYLRSRGVSLEAARHLLSYAFAADVTRRIKVEPVRRRLEDFMAAQHGLPQDLRITDLGSHDAAHR
jgi:Fe-S cluster assembly protein SufD